MLAKSGKEIQKITLNEKNTETETDFHQTSTLFEILFLITIFVHLESNSSKRTNEKKIEAPFFLRIY